MNNINLPQIQEVTRVLNYRSSTAASTSATDRQKCPLTGRITQILLHFPAGCNALVRTKVLHNGLSILPTDDWIALDDTTPIYPMNWPVNITDYLDVVIENTDAVFAHTLTITITITGVEGV